MVRLSHIIVTHTFGALLLAPLYRARSIDPRKGPPIDEQLWDKPVNLEEEAPADLGLFYDEYLNKVLTALSEHKKFGEQLEGKTMEELKNGDIHIDLKEVAASIRTKLNDLKRTEVERIRHLARAIKESEEGKKMNSRTEREMKDIAAHLHTDVSTEFTVEDLRKLAAAAANDMENYDEERHNRFKKYEMHKTMRQEEKSAMSPEERKKEEARLADLKTKHEDHEKINHPGHKKQMEEVWGEEDGMKDAPFDPKAFFKLHDTNSDGQWDVYEVEAMMKHELSKAWDENNAEDDMTERDEERVRMREEIFKEADTNGDKMISEAEWLQYAGSPEFEKEPEWETVDDKIDGDKIYNDHELEEYKAYIHKHEEQFKDKFEQLKTDSGELTQVKFDHRKMMLRGNVTNTEIADHLKVVNEKQKALMLLAEEVSKIANELTSMKLSYEETKKSKEVYEKELDVIHAEQKAALSRAEDEIQRIVNLHKQDEGEIPAEHQS